MRDKLNSLWDNDPDNVDHDQKLRMKDAERRRHERGILLPWETDKIEIDSKNSDEEVCEPPD